MIITWLLGIRDHEGKLTLFSSCIKVILTYLSQGSKFIMQYRMLLLDVRGLVTLTVESEHLKFQSTDTIIVMRYPG